MTRQECSTIELQDRIVFDDNGIRRTGHVVGRSKEPGDWFTVMVYGFQGAIRVGCASVRGVMSKPGAGT